MQIVISGLEEEVCRAVLGLNFWKARDIAWLPHDQISVDGPWASDTQLLWFYRSPASMILQANVVGEDSSQLLDDWFAFNRLALNLRKNLKFIYFINVDNVRPDEIRAHFGSGQACDQLPAIVEHEDESLLPAISYILNLAVPRYSELFTQLEALAWSPSDSKKLSLIGLERIDEAELMHLLGSVRPKACFMRLHESEIALAASNDEVQRLEKAFNTAKEEALKYEQRCHDSRREIEWLLLQAHRMQEEVERLHIKSVELASDNAEERTRTVSLQQNEKALRLQLNQMQRELQEFNQSGLLRKSSVARLLPGRILGRMKDYRAGKARKIELDRMRKSEWFDAKWYLEKYPDVGRANMDPVEHYFDFGWRERRDPSASFDTSYYLDQNLDVASADTNPLLHFIRYGCNEGRLPHRS